MKPFPLGWIFCAAVALPALFAAGQESGNKHLPLINPIFGDHMVLQRGKPSRFWGWSEPGGTVSVGIDGRTGSAAAGADGRWMVTMDATPAGGPYSVTVTGQSRRVLQDVLVGDVWICGGQSNMAFPLRDSSHGAAEVQSASHPDLRLCKVGQQIAYEPGSISQQNWSACTPTSTADFSAVAYYFARRLQADIHVPIGLIEDCVGGSPAESWMSAEALAREGDFAPQLAETRRLAARGGPRYGSFLMHWLDEYDPGGRDGTWAKPDFDDEGWKPVEVPGSFAELGPGIVPSVCWFRREFTLPAGFPAGPARIVLGVIEKMDTTYVNGRPVGASSWVENPRSYVIPAGNLKPGRNRIAVRVFKTKAAGGFLSGAAVLRIELADGTIIPLAGTWKGTVSVDARPPHPLPLDFENFATMPASLYNGMIAPIAPIALAGAIWYQGEGNTSHPERYRRLLTGLISDWRSRFQQLDLPFYVVSLPAFTAHRVVPGDDGWARLREAQAQAVSDTAHTELAVTIDTGEADNVHPREKRIVGERLALCALAEHYRLAVPFSGPVFNSLHHLRGALLLNFTHTGDGMTVHGEAMPEFSIAGKDRLWRWARVNVDRDGVIVSSPDVPEPVAARYAWQANPVATLFNSDGLPAAPFRTDDWPPETAPAAGP